MDYPESSGSTGSHDSYMGQWKEVYMSCQCQEHGKQGEVITHVPCVIARQNSYELSLVPMKTCKNCFKNGK